MSARPRTTRIPKSFRLSKETVELLDHASATLDRSTTAILEDAIARYLGPAHGSSIVYERLDELAERVCTLEDEVDILKRVGVGPPEDRDSPPMPARQPACPVPAGMDKEI